MNATQAVSRMRQVLRRQYKALASKETYVHWLCHYMAALQKMPPSLASERKVECFLTGLAAHRNVAASTQNQAFNANPDASCGATRLRQSSDRSHIRNAA